MEGGWVVFVPWESIRAERDDAQKFKIEWVGSVPCSAVPERDARCSCTLLLGLWDTPSLGHPVSGGGDARGPTEPTSQAKQRTHCPCAIDATPGWTSLQKTRKIDWIVELGVGGHVQFCAGLGMEKFAIRVRVS